jgi:aspartyl-tRNA(Asn)/glutamyl-tRNA(Gln) amidotransferase subunit A
MPSKTSAQPLHFLTIRQASRLIKKCELSPVELTRAFLDRIEKVDKKTKSYITLTPDSALKEARAAEAEILKGKYRGPLHGIPLAHKDLYDTKGIRTTAQSKVHEHRVPTEDATTIARLKQAGSVMLGKLAMYEFAMGGPTTPLLEQPRNPWDLDYTTTGSSSGSGAAVAAGLCMGSLGSDTGGSIRGPATCCGIVGLKPTYGRVSRYGVIPLSWSLDHCGPMTWTVEDTAYMLQAIAGYDPKDPTTSRAPVPDYSRSLREDIKGMVVGIPSHYFFTSKNGADTETIAIVKKAVTQLEEMGAKIQDVKIPGLEHVNVSNFVILAAEAFSYHHANFKTQPHNYGDNFLDRVYLGGVFTADDYAQAQRARSRLKREFAKVLQKVDVIASPTASFPPFLFEKFSATTIAVTPSFTAPYNQTGMPAISIPCGFNKKKMPIGLQIAAKPFDEPTMLRVAYAYQQHAQLYKKRPPI